MEWSDLPDTPENRALVLRAHHVTDWSVNEMEIARLFALGIPEDEIARRVRVPVHEVEAELLMIAARIFVEPNWRVLNGIGCVPAWLHLHARCCIPEWEAEVATTDPSELPEEFAKDHRSLPRWKVWDEAERMREREDPRAPSVRRKKPDRR